MALMAASRAEAAVPVWALTAVAAPRSFMPGESGGRDRFLVEATNVGSAGMTGAVTITDSLPAGLTAVGIEGEGAGHTCTLTPLSCVFTSGPRPARRLAVVIRVNVDPVAPSSVTDEATVSGGGAPGASAREPMQISSTPTVFGFEGFSFSVTNEDGSANTQAGSRPYAITADIGLNQTVDSEGKITTAGSVKDLGLELPEGMIVNPYAAPLCTDTQFSSNDCPDSAAVGVAFTTFEGKMFPAAVYNLVPAPGELARLGIVVGGKIPIVVDLSLRSDGDGMVARIANITQTQALAGIRLLLWGVPSDPSHDRLRGRCATDEEETQCPSEVPLASFLTLPATCAGPLQTTARGDSWQEPNVWLIESDEVAQMTGCDLPHFEPTLGITPETTQAEEPSGLQLQVQIPQSESPTELSAAPLQNAKLTLPEAISLAAMAGLEGCGEAQIALGSSEPPRCPSASAVGRVELKTPILADPVEGAVFLAEQNANPFGSLIALYLNVEEPRSGTRVKLAGELTLNPTTGQPTISFRNMPQLPISDFRLEFFGGRQALFANPQTCGDATASSQLTPWSSGPGATPSSSFQVTWETTGGACPNPLPFEPSLQTETATPTAGSFSPLTLRVSRGERQQYLSALAIQLPPGLKWMLAGVPLCVEPQAATGQCSQTSQIGTATLIAGAGSGPLPLAGTVYLTEGYMGAPYGLSIVIDAVAGPLDLGKLTVRAALAPQSSGALTVTSSPIPISIDGIPLSIRNFSLTINRSEFVLNPSTCVTTQITAMIDGLRGAAVEASNPFTTSGCESPAPVAQRTPGPASPAPGGPSPAKHARKPSISHIRAKLSGSHLLLFFTTSLKGPVTITGQATRKYRKVLRSGNHTIKLTLSKRGAIDRRHHRRVRLALTLKTSSGSVTTRIILRL
jgi:hypothetical protein